MIEDEALHFNEVRVLYTDFKVGLYVYTEYQYIQIHAGVCVCTCMIYKMILDITKQFMKHIATGTRKRSCSRLVFSAVHKNRPCTPCVLCNETHSVYTHPGKWKDENVLHFLERIEPDSHIGPDSCICRNC